MSCYSETIGYWKIKELEENQWSGGVVFLNGENQAGRILFSEGLISWADSVTQTENLFTALQSLAQVGKEDILFAESLFQEKKGKSNFVNILESSGLVAFWTLRECLRVHINSAVKDLLCNSDLKIVENENLKISASKHVYTLDELELAQSFSETSGFDYGKISGVDYIEVRTRLDGIIMKWPEEAPYDETIDIISGVRDYIDSEKSDYIEVPFLTTFHYRHGVYIHSILPDIYGTSLFSRLGTVQDINSVIQAFKKFPTYIIMQLSNTTIPIRTMADEEDDG
ncbi:MAG: hypothetical protein JXR95_00435 [Deltaproteobacteria bacterium]|nr:hypothetical protein [Deltaproteobacteria bacterium]